MRFRWLQGVPQDDLLPIPPDLNSVRIKLFLREICFVRPLSRVLQRLIRKHSLHGLVSTRHLKLNRRLLRH